MVGIVVVPHASPTSFQSQPWAVSSPLESRLFSPQGSHGSRPRVVLTDLASFVFRAQKLWHASNLKLSLRIQRDLLLVFILFEARFLTIFYFPSLIYKENIQLSFYEHWQDLAYHEPKALINNFCKTWIGTHEWHINEILSETLKHLTISEHPDVLPSTETKCTNTFLKMVFILTADYFCLSTCVEICVSGFLWNRLLPLLLGSFICYLCYDCDVRIAWKLDQNNDSLIYFLRAQCL